MHAGEKSLLTCKCPTFSLRCDMVAEQICDCRQAFTQQCYDVKYGTNFKVNGPVYAANLKDTFNPYEDFLGDRLWMAGNNITWAGKRFL